MVRDSIGRRVLVTEWNGQLPGYDLTFKTGAALSGAELIHFLADGPFFDEVALLDPGRARQCPAAPSAVSDGKTRKVDIQRLREASREWGSGILFTQLALGTRLREVGLSRPMPVVFQNHSLSYSCLTHRVFLDLRSDLRPYDCLVALSRSHLDAARRLYEHAAEECAPLLSGIGGPRFPRFELIPGGIDAEVFHPGDGRAAKRALGLPEDAIVLLSLSRITISDKMDVLPLLRGFREGFAQDPRVLLVVAGEGRHNNHLEVTRGIVREMGLDARVRFVAGPRLSLVYQAGDIFVSPNDTPTEAFPRTALEAMSTGLPVVASDWDGLRDSVVDGETGFLVPTLWGNAQSHAERIRPVVDPFTAHLFLGQTVSVDMGAFFRRLKQLVDSPELRTRMGANGRRRVLDRFDWRRILPLYEALFRDLIEEAARDDGREAPAGARGCLFRPQPEEIFHGYATRHLSHAPHASHWGLAASGSTSSEGHRHVEGQDDVGSRGGE